MLSCLISGIAPGVVRASCWAFRNGRVAAGNVAVPGRLGVQQLASADHDQSWRAREATGRVRLIRRPSSPCLRRSRQRVVPPICVSPVWRAPKRDARSPDGRRVCVPFTADVTHDDEPPKAADHRHAPSAKRHEGSTQLRPHCSERVLGVGGSMNIRRWRVLACRPSRKPPSPDGDD